MGFVTIRGKNMEKGREDGHVPFSRRMGFVHIEDRFQKNEMDVRLRTRLWNRMYSHFLRNYDSVLPLSSMDRKGRMFIEMIWHRFFGSELPSWSSSTYRLIEEMKEKYDELEWYRVYDLVEMIMRILDADMGIILEREFNQDLEDEMSYYRIVAGTVTPMLDEEEEKSLIEALDIPYETAREHLKKALILLSRREDPDFNNSIKESISALESLCQALDNSHKTLGDCIKALAQRTGVNGILADSLSKMYASASELVRHGKKEEVEVDLDDAKFFLISCSAWMNYIYMRAEKSGIVEGM
jgi:hypothetical protein